MITSIDEENPNISHNTKNQFDNSVPSINYGAISKKHSNNTFSKEDNSSNKDLDYKELLMTDKKFNRHYNNDFNNYNNNSNNTNNSNNVNYNPTIQIKKVEYYENFPRSIENNKIKDNELNHNTNDKIKRKEEKKSKYINIYIENPKNQEKWEILHTQGYAARKKEDYGSAIELYTKALEVNPKYFKVFRILIKGFVQSRICL
jgi:tetratricopeptide (TPR) repeat protein